ncbi:MAG: patatin-like phospholipase family protein [Verrucomicrobiales bacterium]|nr:patatin-like phospholipase family protein [Verrucomicrobiales bacterium]
MNYRGTIACLLASVWMAMTTGCGTLRHRNALPELHSVHAQIPGYTDIRDWGDQHSPVLRRSVEQALHQQAAHTGQSVQTLASQPVSILALSGGGMNGAFGAGFLCGWTQHGSRPQFDLVTGISAGSLLAPFAFLGTNHDGTLCQIQAELGPKGIVRRKGFLHLLREDSLFDTTPLQRLLERYITPELVEQIAQEHAKGRRLWVGTANLDSRRPVIWDLGAVAASNRPDAPELFRQVLLASSAIPGAFPPVYFNVEANGRTFDEMHVDGGVGFQVFAYGVVVNLDNELRQADKQLPARPARLFIIRNGELRPHYHPVNARVVPIIMNSINTLTYRQSMGDLYRMFAYAGRDQVDFNLAGLPSDYRPQTQTEFDPEEMKRLFDLGQDLARRGYQWIRTPPGYGPTD